MYILQVNFAYRNMSPALHAANNTEDRAKPFLDVQGLLWKIWLDGAEPNRVGGIYLFASMAQAQAYLDGPIVAGMRANPNVAELTTVLSDVRERMSAITHAPVPGLDAILPRAAE